MEETKRKLGHANTFVKNRATTQPSKLCTAHLSVDHVRDHHDLVALCVGKLQREFGGLYVKRQNNRVL